MLAKGGGGIGFICASQQVVEAISETDNEDAAEDGNSVPDRKRRVQGLNASRTRRLDVADRRRQRVLLLTAARMGLRAGRLGGLRHDRTVHTRLSPVILCPCYLSGGQCRMFYGIGSLHGEVGFGHERWGFDAHRSTWPGIIAGSRIAAISLPDDCLTNSPCSCREMGPRPRTNPVVGWDCQL